MSSFDKSSAVARMGLDIRLDCEHTLAHFDAIDERAVSYLAANSERIFNKPSRLSRSRPATTRA